MKYIRAEWEDMPWWMRLALGALVVIGLLKLSAIGSYEAKPTPLPAQAIEATVPMRLADDAMDLCESAVLGSATNRSSVKLKSPYPLPRLTKINNQLVIYTRFSGKNGFGSESVSLARCVVSVDGRNLIEMSVQDSR